ncbi:MAG: hypothetical protein HDR71_15610 [Lachnospiraceae bacterium]|nr:hypothetical protein [Lachnospiraceae bacterium]
MPNYGYILQMRGVWEMPNEKFFIKIGNKVIKGSAILLVIIAPLIVSFVANMTYDWFKDKVSKDPEVTLEDLQASINKIEERLDKLENPEESTSDNNITIEGDNNTINLGKLKQPPVGLLEISQGSGELAVKLGEPTQKLIGSILIDTECGNTYTVEQAINQEILLTYKNGNEEIYFLGQFNENNNWNGECLINVYENNILKSIMEANYDNGRLTTYKQVIKTKTSKGIDVWGISDKEHKEKHNIGVTKNYIYTVYNQEVSSENVSKEDMIKVDTFEGIMKEVSTLEGYYSGKTSSGLYNDDTGNAYMAKYYEDGTIRLLYRGRFKDGYPEDKRNTEEVWGISYSEEGLYYVRNVGRYEKGQAKSRSNKAISIDEINEIVSQYNFECELKWKEN